ncbi:MAG: hypothetical protein K2Y23_09900 [Cyanobacteria bacterium]|nr:hypothetical protein [Cyanobacteriota bacterium]
MSRLTPEDAIKALESSPSEDLRLAAGISILTLFIAQKLHTEVMTLVDALPSAVRKTAVNPAHDVVVFEAAAYCHFQLMKEYLGDEDDSHDGDYYFNALREAVHLTSALLKSHTEFSVDERLFANRVIRYSMKVGPLAVRDETAELEALVLQSLQKGSPIGAAHAPTLLNLALGIALKTAIAIFHNTWMTPLRQTAQNLHQYDLDNPA